MPDADAARANDRGADARADRGGRLTLLAARDGVMLSDEGTVVMNHGASRVIQ
jgi:hypothetical protein